MKNRRENSKGQESDRSVPRKPRLVGEVKGHTMNEISFARLLLATTCPGSPAPWAGSFNLSFLSTGLEGVGP